MYKVKYSDIDSNSTIIDIRNNNKYLEGHIKNSININEYNLIYNYNKYLDKKNKYYIYCDYGNRSSFIVQYLRKLGFIVFDIEGGYNNYLLGK